MISFECALCFSAPASRSMHAVAFFGTFTVKRFPHTLLRPLSGTIIPILILTISVRSSCCLPLPFPLLGFFLKNVAGCFSFVSLNSLMDRFFFQLVSSRTFISLLFARSFLHLGQNLNETCKDSPHVEQNRASVEGLNIITFCPKCNKLLSCKLQ